MAPQDTLGLAKQGNSKAIAALLNRSLQTENITVEAELRDGHLHVLLESNQVPNQQVMVAFIYSAIMSLRAESIKTIKVYGCELSASSGWYQEIQVNLPAVPQLPGSTAQQETLSDRSQKTKFNRRRKAAKSKRRQFIQNTFQDNPFVIKARSLFLWAILILLLLIVCLAIAALAGINIEDAIVAPIGYSMMFGLLCFWALRRCGQLQINVRRIVGNLPKNQRWLPIIGIVVPLFLFSSGAFQVAYYFLSFIAPSFVEATINQDILTQTFSPPLYKLLAVISEVLVTPVTEEFLFRGLLLHRWTVKWGMRLAILVSSLAFGVLYLHRNFIGAYVLGLVMALLYIKTRTLIVPIICHALYNAIVVIKEVVLTSSSFNEIYTVEQFRSEWWLGVLYVIISAPLLIIFIYKNWPTKRASTPYTNNSK